MEAPPLLWLRFPVFTRPTTPELRSTSGETPSPTPTLCQARLSGMAAKCIADALSVHIAMWNECVIRIRESYCRVNRNRGALDSMTFGDAELDSVEITECHMAISPEFQFLFEYSLPIHMTEARFWVAYLTVSIV